MSNMTPRAGELGGLPRDVQEAVFEYPWQAQIFSITLHLHQAGRFAWRDWVEVFSDEIKASPARPEESANDAYYRQWAAALEKLVAALGLSAAEELTARAAQWRQAYLNTPHGQPIELAHALCPPAGHDHAHGPRREPVAVSPGLVPAHHAP